eukprot:TRINITY_DN11098_c0_g1_i1.p1 TRINITY_DN11098_c0_g1~~TRINITY_DN11098_c0_g1_i1.p1  ORF type:complete len:759 (+),score=193.20 TRINITY_DN11098_c0_g1_i1:120-2396(+)
MPISEITAELVDGICDGYSSLTVLNLSCNDITRIENLERLTTLERLNLESNQIEVVENLQSLTSLVELNLANNQISTIAGIAALARLPSLTTLILEGNPICNIPDYRATISRFVPQLTFLDHEALPALPTSSAIQAPPQSQPQAAIPVPQLAQPPVYQPLVTPFAASAPQPSYQPALQQQQQPPQQSYLQRDDLRIRREQIVTQELRSRREQSLSDENAALRSKVQLQDVRLQSLQEILRIQEEALQKLRGGEERAVEDLQQKWRSKLFEQLVHSKSTDMLVDSVKREYEHRMAEIERELQNAQDDAAAGVQRETALRAELEIERSATRMTRSTLAKVESHEQRLKADVQRERQACKRVYELLHRVSAESAVFEEHVKQLFARLNTLGQRVNFATGRLQLLKDFTTKVERPEEDQMLQASPRRLCDLPISQQTMDTLVQEIDRLTRERDAMAKRVAHADQIEAEHIRDVRSQMEKQQRERIEEISQLRQELTAADQEAKRAAALQRSLQALQETLTATEQRVIELTAELERSQQSARKELQSAVRRATDDGQAKSIQQQAEIDELRSQVAKQASTIRVLERSLAMQREKDSSAENARFDDLQQQISSRDEKLRKMQKERHELLATVRQFERAATITGGVSNTTAAHSTSGARPPVTRSRSRSRSRSPPRGREHTQHQSYVSAAAPSVAPPARSAAAPSAMSGGHHAINRYPPTTTTATGKNAGLRESTHSRLSDAERRELPDVVSWAKNLLKDDDDDM